MGFLAVDPGHERLPFRAWLTLAVIVAGAAILTGRGMTFGLPYFYHFDEPALVQIGARVVQNGELNPKWFHYPTLAGYLQAPAYACAYLHACQTNPEWVPIQKLPLSTFYLWGRGLTVLLALATVVAVFFLAQRFTGSIAAGFWSVAILALMSGFSEEARYITPNVPSALFATLAALPLMRPTERTWRRAVIAGLLAGLAVATKYNLVLMVIVLAFVVLIDHPSEALKRGHVAVAILLVVAAGVGVAIGSPFALVELPRFLNDLGSELHHYSQAGHVGAQGEHNLRFLLGFLLNKGLGGVISVLVVAGGVVAIRRRAWFSPVVLFPVLSLLSLSRFKVNFPRNLVPTYPFLAVWAGVAVVAIGHWLDRRTGRPSLRIIWTLCVATALVVPATSVWRFGSELRRPDTRTLARQWILDNIPEGQKVYLETERKKPHPYGGWVKAPPLPAERYDLIPVKDLCQFMEPEEVIGEGPVTVVLCHDEQYYRSHFGHAGARRFRRWKSSFSVRQKFSRWIDGPGPTILVLQRKPAPS